MNPVDFEKAVKRGKPEGWSEEEHGKVTPLPTAMMLVGGVACSVSYWRPSIQDMEKLLRADGFISLIVFGGQPPVNLSVVTADEVEIDGEQMMVKGLVEWER